MKFCFITSIPHLYDFAVKSDWHLILVHLFESDLEYEWFYRKRKDRGDYIILDNSFYELGESVSMKRILDIVKTFSPNEVVAPETENLVEYKKILRTFKQKLLDLSFLGKVHAVVKGSSLEEYLKCYEMLAENRNVDVLGIPVGMSRVCRRTEFFNELVKKNMLCGKEHHLLGLEFPEELKELKQYVRSCDSSLPFWMGVWGIKIYKFGLLYKKVPVKLDFEYKLEYPQQYSIIKYNIRTIKRLIK